MFKTFVSLFSGHASYIQELRKTIEIVLNWTVLDGTASWSLKSQADE